MDTKHHILVASILLSSSFEALPQSNVKEHRLEKGSTISQLLNDLNFRKIYQTSIIDEVLKLNNLDQESAKKIKPGAVILIPASATELTEASSEMSIPTETNAETKAEPEALPETVVMPQVEEPKEPVTYNHEIQAGGSAFNLEGKSKDKTAKIKGDTVMGYASYEIRSSGKYFYGGHFLAAYTMIDSQKSYSIDKEALQLNGGLRAGNFSLMAQLGGKRDFYFFSKSGKEKLTTGLVPTAGVRAEGKFGSWRLGADLTQALSASVGSGQTTKTNMSYSADLSYLFENQYINGVLVRYRHDDKDLKSFSQDSREITLGLVKIFE